MINLTRDKAWLLKLCTFIALAIGSYLPIFSSIHAAEVVGYWDFSDQKLANMVSDSYALDAIAESDQSVFIAYQTAYSQQANFLLQTSATAFEVESIPFSLDDNWNISMHLFDNSVSFSGSDSVLELYDAGGVLALIVQRTANNTLAVQFKSTSAETITSVITLANDDWQTLAEQTQVHIAIEKNTDFNDVTLLQILINGQVKESMTVSSISESEGATRLIVNGGLEGNGSVQTNTSQTGLDNIYLIQDALSSVQKECLAKNVAACLAISKRGAVGESGVTLSAEAIAEVNLMGSQGNMQEADPGETITDARITSQGILQVEKKNIGDSATGTWLNVGKVALDGSDLSQQPTPGSNGVLLQSNSAVLSGSEENLSLSLTSGVSANIGSVAGEHNLTYETPEPAFVGNTINSARTSNTTVYPNECNYNGYDTYVPLILGGITAVLPPNPTDEGCTQAISESDAYVSESNFSMSFTAGGADNTTVTLTRDLMGDNGTRGSSGQITYHQGNDGEGPVYFNGATQSGNTVTLTDNKGGRYNLGTVKGSTGAAGVVGNNVYFKAATLQVTSYYYNGSFLGGYSTTLSYPSHFSKDECRITFDQMMYSYDSISESTVKAELSEDNASSAYWTFKCSASGTCSARYLIACIKEG